MRLFSECVYCIVDHHWSLVKDCPDEARKLEFMRRVCDLAARSDPAMAAPVLTAKLQTLYARMFPECDDYPELKRKYNAMLLERLPDLRARLRAAEDPLRLGVWMAMAGNYIDFGLLMQIDDAHLNQMLLCPDARALDGGELDRLRAELSRARRLAYVTDNCGEIVLDRLLIEVLGALYPQLAITAIVRGEQVFNDATCEDARFVGLDEAARIVGNGSNIGGTQMEFLGEEAREALLGADLIISKGQGNFETLTGTGLNIYYLFLAKCRHYPKWFGMEHMAAQLVNERRFQKQ